MDHYCRANLQRDFLGSGTTVQPKVWLATEAFSPLPGTRTRHT